MSNTKKKLRKYRKNLVRRGLELLRQARGYLLNYHNNDKCMVAIVNLLNSHEAELGPKCTPLELVDYAQKLADAAENVREIFLEQLKKAGVDLQSANKFMYGCGKARLPLQAKVSILPGGDEFSISLTAMQLTQLGDYTHVVLSYPKPQAEAKPPENNYVTAIVYPIDFPDIYLEPVETVLLSKGAAEKLGCENGDWIWLSDAYYDLGSIFKPLKPPPEDEEDDQDPWNNQS
ncbi:MAG: hypothetical protein WCW02_02770 [Candidatus Buchananbacteria bacterium]